MKSLNNLIMPYKKNVSILLLILFSVIHLEAKQNIGLPDKKVQKTELLGKGGNCLPATAQAELNVNNVRTRILNGGDMWWDLSSAKYEVPKVVPPSVPKHSMFAGAIWIGGVTNGNIRVAAQTYRQNGNDYYPGPLSIGTASISAERCKDFDKIWNVYLTDIDKFRNDPLNWVNAPDAIQNWPCNGDLTKGESKYLAPFYDANNDGKYEWLKGDYPTFDQNVTKNIPDQMMYIIYNDKGNIHSETDSPNPIGLEFQTQAFAYSTNDEINNMTFYRTKVTNQGTDKIDSCVFGQWVDPDLGNYADDYVECDVTRNLGICYNGEDIDPGPMGYGLNPPSIGVNFFQGPKRPDGSEIGLTKFVYYNNDFSQQGNPQKPEHYWQYLNGRWKDGSQITYGGQGKGGTDTASYMFPGTTDPAGRPNWTEVTAGNQPYDRRFLQTAGSFTLLPGAVNYVTIAVIWARASSGGARGSFNLLKLASDRAYSLYKNNFTLVQGPKAPTLTVTELNRKLLFTITNTNTIENFIDSFGGSGCKTLTHYKFQGYVVYQLKTASIPSDLYDVTQAQVVAQFDLQDSIGRIDNLIYDPALESNVKKIMVIGSNTGIQHSFMIDKDKFQTGTDQTLVNFTNYHYLLVAYANAIDCKTNPIQYLSSTKTIGENSLHIYTASPHDPAPRGIGTQLNSDYGDGIPVTQHEGTGNGGNAIMLTQESILEAIAAPNYYAKQKSYVIGGSPVYIKVINPLAVPEGNFILWMKDTSNSSKKEDTLTSSKTSWYIKRVGTNEVVLSEQSISNPYEQIIPQWGLSINLNQCIQPGNTSSTFDQSNGYISSSISYANPTGIKWLSGITDDDAIGGPTQLVPQFNWIRAGTNGGNDGYILDATHLNNDFAYSVTVGTETKYFPIDPTKAYNKIINATWSPYCLTSRYILSNSNPSLLDSYGPGCKITGNTAAASSYNSLADLQSIIVVFTSDKSKWSRCIVLESGEDKYNNIPNTSALITDANYYTDKLDIRASKSVDKNGKPAANGSGASTNPDDPNYISETGMGWFPGYVVNLETGERLNLLFAEDSSMPTENGTDMIWNPSAGIVTFKAPQYTPLFGGKHFIYVMGNKKYSQGTIRFIPTKYDECRTYLALMGNKQDDNGLNRDANGHLTNALGVPTAYVYSKRKQIFFTQALYTSIPVALNKFALLSPAEGLIPNDVTITINVKKPYASYLMNNDTSYNSGMPYYTFNTKGLSPETNISFAKKALDLVNVVPNPYYAFSTYEDPGNPLDTRVKITNLPKVCEINIYTLDGVLVRRIKRDDDTKTSFEWDLKNDSKVPIVSGIYLIHIKATELGEERILKWFGVMRPADYDSF